MRRDFGVRAAAVGMCVGLLLTACSPDVVRAGGPRAIGGAASSDSSGNDGSLPSDQPTEVCGVDQGGTQPADSLLTSRDVWPDAGDAAQIASDISLATDACRAAVAAAPVPLAVACEIGFPWYGSDALPVELARLGVARVRNAELLRVRPDRSVSGRVSEFVLTLTGTAAATLESSATHCGGIRTAGHGPLVYTMRDSSGGISVAVRIDYDQAVGLTFTGIGLDDAAKLALLDKAVGLAARGV